MKIIRSILLVGILTVLVSVFTSRAVSAQTKTIRDDRMEKLEELRTEKQEGVCNRIEIAWEARFKGYERAKEVRKTAFERTQERWGRLFDKLDEMEVSTVEVRADAAEVKVKFDALMVADDNMLAAMKQVAVAACAGEGQAEAKEELGVAQRVRREARAAYNVSLKKLHTDLSGLRRSITSEESN